jgi:hypothetical protein
MPETVNTLTAALEAEAALFLRMVGELENEELYEFIRRVAALEPRHISGGRNATEDILHVAQNVKGIETALDNFYVA